MAHSEESEIYRCNDPRQGGGEVFSQPVGKLTSLRDREREMCEEKGAKWWWRRTVPQRAGRPAGGIRAERVECIYVVAPFEPHKRKKNFRPALSLKSR